MTYFKKKPPPPKPETIYELMRRLPRKMRVLIGTVSGMAATTFVHPLDVMKLRAQINEGAISTKTLLRLMVKCEGWSSLYAGLSAGLMRQLSATSTRLAVYHLLSDHLKKKYNQPLTQTLPTSDKVWIGIYAGMAGGFVGTPSDVVLVRMMADGPKMPCSVCNKVRRYNGVFHAFFRIVQEDGIRALWRGGTLTMGRSVIISFAHLGTLSEVNARLRDRKILQGFSLQFVSSLVASFITSILSAPVDLVKSRYQVRIDHHQTPKEIFHDILVKDGILHFWKGFIPYFCRMTIHTMTSVTVFGCLTRFYYLQKEKGTPF